MTTGCPEDDVCLRGRIAQGRSVLIVTAEDGAEAARFRELLKAEGAEEVDAAREQWWIGLRGAELEHYSSTGRKFGDDEKFYRMDSRARCTRVRAAKNTIKS